MGKYFSFENYKKFYNYILYSIFSFLFNYLCFGINYDGGFETLRFFPFDSQEKYSSHFLIRQIFCYIGTFIMSILFYFIGEKRVLKDSKKYIIGNSRSSGSTRSSSSIVYIYAKKKKVSIPFFTLIIFLWFFLEQTIEKFSTIFPHMDFWMIELIIITFLNSKILKINIYKHHLFVIFFNLFPILFKIITIFLSFVDSDYNEKSKYLNSNNSFKYLYVVYWYLLIIGVIIYLPLITLRAYTNIQLK